MLKLYTNDRINNSYVLRTICPFPDEHNHEKINVKNEVEAGFKIKYLLKACNYQYKKKNSLDDQIFVPKGLNATTLRYLYLALCRLKGCLKSGKAQSNQPQGNFFSLFFLSFPHICSWPIFNALLTVNYHCTFFSVYVCAIIPSQTSALIVRHDYIWQFACPFILLYWVRIPFLPTGVGVVGWCDGARQTSSAGRPTNLD